MPQEESSLIVTACRVIDTSRSSRRRVDQQHRVALGKRFLPPPNASGRERSFTHPYRFEKAGGGSVAAGVTMTDGRCEFEPRAPRR